MKGNKVNYIEILFTVKLQFLIYKKQKSQNLKEGDLEGMNFEIELNLICGNPENYCSLNFCTFCQLFLTKYELRFYLLKL